MHLQLVMRLGGSRSRMNTGPERGAVVCCAGALLKQLPYSEMRKDTITFYDEEDALRSIDCSLCPWPDKVVTGADTERLFVC
jgi:hypothetical protein